MCGQDAQDRSMDGENWDGFLEEIVEAPTPGPIVMEWPSTQDIARLLKAAGTKWDAVGLQPPSVDGYLLPPNYQVGEKETLSQVLERFASDWRRTLRDFDLHRQRQPDLAPSSRHDLQSFLKDGTSNSLPIKLTVLLLKPNQVFGLHVHPTLEMELTLRGALGEVRLVGNDQEKPLEVPYRGPWPRDEENFNKSLCGPNLTNTQQDDGGVSSHYASLASSGAQWKKMESTGAGHYLLNEVGSIHKSFTESEPFAGLVLWGGIHANIKSKHEGTDIPNSELLEM